MPRPCVAARTLAASMLVALTAGTPPAAIAGRAHEHGVVRLDVTIEGDRLGVAAEMPLDALLGFERAPRTEAERRAAAAVLARLRAPGALFAADAAAECALIRAEVAAPVLEGAARPVDGHADLDAQFEFRCARPAHLRTLDVALFDAFPRVQRIVVQIAAPQGQSKTTLRRPARSVGLVR